MAVRLKAWSVETTKKRARIEFEVDQEGAEDLLDALDQKSRRDRHRDFLTVLTAHWPKLEDFDG